MWQALRNELHPRGLEIVTIALDVDAEAARQWIEQSRPNHPSLIDSAHRVDELFGVSKKVKGFKMRPDNYLWVRDTYVEA